MTAVQSASDAAFKLVTFSCGKSKFSGMLTKFLPHLVVIVAGLVLAWYFDTFSFGPFTYTAKKKANAVDELLKKKHQVVGNECIPETNTCFLIVDSYYLENSRLTTKRDLLLGENTEYSLTGVEVESTKRKLHKIIADPTTQSFLAVSWDNIDSRHWPVNKLVINARYARLLVASGFIMDSLNFDENDHHDVLIAGLGGGVMSNFLSEISYLNIETTVVEKEQFIIDLAEQYFDHFETEHLKIVHDDVVDFIRTNDKKYDVIIVDACENQVADVMCPVAPILTPETVQLFKKRLTLESTLAVNIYISKDNAKKETSILNIFLKEFKSCFFLEYFKNKKLYAGLERLIAARPRELDDRRLHNRLRFLNVALQIRLLETRIGMLNQQHNQQAQLVNVQRPHQIQPPNGPLRLVPAQGLPQGQPVAVRIQGEPISIGQAQIVNVQGQRQIIAQQGQLNMGQVRQPMQHQQQAHGQNQQPHQVRGNPQQQQQMRGMTGNGQSQQQNQMRMQQNQQMMNGPQGQQRMQGQSNMQQNQQMRMQQGQPQQQNQMRMQHPQQQMQSRQQSPMNQQQQQGQMQMQQPMMRDNQQQMQQGQSNMGGHTQQRMQNQMPHDQQKMQHGGHSNMNARSPQPPQMQQGHQNMNGPMQQQMRPQQHMSSQGSQNQQMSPLVRGQMQNSPQMRMAPSQQQQSFQPSPQQAQPMLQGRPLQQIAPGRRTPQMQQQQQRQQMPMNRNAQQGPPQHNSAPEQHSQQVQPTSLQLPAQAVIQESGQMIRINGDHAIINGMEFRLLQVQPGESNGQIQLVNTNPNQNSGASQIQLQRVELPPGGLQKVTLQHRTSSHQLIAPAPHHSPMNQMQQNHQPNQPMMIQQQQGMQNVQQRPPSQPARPTPPPQRPKAPTKPRNRSKKIPAPADDYPELQPQTSDMNEQMNESHNMRMMSGTPNGSMSNGPMSNGGMSSGMTPQQTPQKQRGRSIGPPNGQIGQQGAPNGMRNDRSYSPNPQMVQQGKHLVQVGGMPPDLQREVPRQQHMRQGVPSNQRPNGTMPPSRNQPSTSQPSTSQQRPPAKPLEMTVIKDAIISHVRGTRKMTPEYIKYVTDELSRVLREMEKVGLNTDSRYVSTQRLLALVQGEDPTKIEDLPRRERPPQPSHDDKREMPDEPLNETPEERQKRYDGYMEYMKNAYPQPVYDVRFPPIDNETIKKEAAYYMKQDMKNRAAYLKENIDKVPENMRTKAKIEYLGLNLVDLQAKVRKDVEDTLIFKPPTEFLINPWSIRRSKAEYAQELKQHPDRAALEKKRRISNNLLLHNLAKHTRDFREFHKSLLAKHTKVRKTMQTHFSNEAKRKSREEMKTEKMRIQKLIQEDEEGYRAMLDDKKDQRLVYLLEQTDGYIESLTDLLKKQQNSGEGVTMRNVRKEFTGEEDERKVKKILDDARNDEDEYEGTKKKNFEDYYTTAHGIREEIKQQHYTMGLGKENLKLKPYQIKGLEWMVSLFNNNLNGILADEMGLGKTIQTIAFITYLMEIKKTSGPFLIIVPLSTISNWKNEFEKWASHVQLIIYKGPKDGRKAIEPVIKSGKFNVLLTTFEYVIREKALLGKLRWKYMIIDEGHRLKNQHCKLTEMLNTRFQCQRRLLITGTPLQNKLPELWALLNFLLPAIFSSCSTFEQWFNAPFATTGEKVELTQEETMLIIRRLHKVLRPFLLRRLKKEVESELPDKMEFVLRCEMSALQKVLYKHMQNGLLLDGKLNTGSRTLMNSMVHLRKLCNHPFLFRNVEDSCRVFWNVPCVTGTDLYRVAGKLELLDRILPKLKASGHRVLMFFQMTSMMTVIEDYFSVRDIEYLRLDGTTKPDERGMLLDQFNAPNSKYFLFMLSTRAGGLGLNLQTADTVIIFDSDWNPHQDMQAQDRAHRIGQKAEVRVFRLITANSVEEKILAAARFKLNVDEKVIQAGKFDNRSTGEERKLMLEAIIKSENEAEEDDDIPTDEDINDMLSRSDEEFDLFQKMDQERYAEEQRTGAKPRLVADSEIPVDILRAANETDYQEKAKEEGREAYLEVMPGSRRKRKDVDYSADSMSDEKFLDKLFDGEDLAPERTEPREEPPVVKPIEPEPEPTSSTVNPPLTFKVPRLVFKFGDEIKRKHNKSESDSDKEKSPKKRKKDDDSRKEKHSEEYPPIQKLKIKWPADLVGLDDAARVKESPKKKSDSEEGTSRKHDDDKERTPKKRKHREEGESSEKKKKKHKHHKHEDLESPVKSVEASSANDSLTSSNAEEEPFNPLKLKLRFKIPQEYLDQEKKEEQERSEQKKKSRENETEEERKARKEARKAEKRLLAEQEEARIQEKLAKKARKEQRRLEKEKLAAAGLANESSAASTSTSVPAPSTSNDIVTTID